MVARLVVSEPGVPVVTITSGLRRTNSAQAPMPPLRPAEFDDKTITFDMPEFTKLFSKCVDDMSFLG